MNEGGFSARGIKFKMDHKICALTGLKNIKKEVRFKDEALYMGQSPDVPTLHII